MASPSLIGLKGLGTTRGDDRAGESYKGTVAGGNQLVA
jgi:hypothetical protein